MSWRDEFYASIIGDHIELLNTFDNNATPEIFEEIFGERIGKHLWDKYTQSASYHVCTLYRYLDDSTREKLCEYLNLQGK